jgi:hypothetical protein
MNTLKNRHWVGIRREPRGKHGNTWKRTVVEETGKCGKTWGEVKCLEGNFAT